MKDFPLAVFEQAFSAWKIIISIFSAKFKASTSNRLNPPPELSFPRFLAGYRK